MTANQLAALISGLALFVALVPIIRRARKQARIRALVWDEIIGHEESQGVPYKPSLTERLNHQIRETATRFARVNQRLSNIEASSSRAADAAEQTKAIVENGNGNGLP